MLKFKIKTEVRFSDERKIYSAVYYAVKTAIENLDTRPRLDLSKVVQKSSVKGVQLQMEEKKNEVFTKVKPEPEKDFWKNISSEDFNRNISVSAPESKNNNVFYPEEPDLIGNSYKNNTKKVSFEFLDTESEAVDNDNGIMVDVASDNIPDLTINSGSEEDVNSAKYEKKEEANSSADMDGTE